MTNENLEFKRNMNRRNETMRGGGQVCSLEKDHKGGKLDFQAFDVATLQHQTEDDQD
jgi:hypothetical protein